MPPVSSAVSVSSKPRSRPFSTSPDSEPTLPEPELQSLPGKKKKKNAANKQNQKNNHNDGAPFSEMAKEETSNTARPQTILSQIPHSFAVPVRQDSPLLDIHHDVDDDDDMATSEKVSDQYTPPNDTWLEDGVYGKSPPAESMPSKAYGTRPRIEPGFSNRVRYESKSPPISPPVRYAKPLSHGGIPPVPAIPKSSPSNYAYASSAYGSPPAPHLPQPHFYHPHDIDLGLPRVNGLSPAEEATLVRQTTLPSSHGKDRPGILLGFDGRLSLARLDAAHVEEIGLLEGFSGTVLDAALLEGSSGPDPFATLRPLVAMVIHGPKDIQNTQHVESAQVELRSGIRQHIGPQNLEHTTRVEVFSLLTSQSLGVLLETPSQPLQSSFRGAPLTPPKPIGALRLQVGGAFLAVSSGISGEIYVFTITDGPQSNFECVGKFWAAIQPLGQRRDSSHQRSSDADISPADLGRITGSTQRDISSLSGRWLAISPASSPSRPSLAATLGPHIACGKLSGAEAASAPAKPSVTCEVDSPDADTIFSKVARGVAQEFVKGAKWLGDQGYQTWQNYWKRDQSLGSGGTPPMLSPPSYATQYAQNMFPPTHGEASRRTKEPELVAIYDLQAIYELSSKRGPDELKPLATFQPPQGCSYVSFAPHGLNLLTAGRKGDVQYVWDLMQIKYCRAQALTSDDERVRTQPRARQVAKFERLSGSTIVDVVWDSLTGSRFAILTKNKTIHLFELPQSAFRWPPPRMYPRLRPGSKSIDNAQHETPMTSGFFASAMNIATQAQPLIANWRGRAPSVGGGLAGIGQTGIGLASATGAKGGKVMVAGLSKSLGAASETMNQIRHAGENRLHLKSSKEPHPGKMFWVQRGRKLFLAVFEFDLIKQYQVGKGDDKRDRDGGAVFAARKGVLIKIPLMSRADAEVNTSHDRDTTDSTPHQGFWKDGPTTSSAAVPLSHPLSRAEIETNAPYQPFHSDRRVIMSIYAELEHDINGQIATASLLANPRSRQQVKQQKFQQQPTPFIFGDGIPTLALNINKVRRSSDGDDHFGSVIYRETTKVNSSIVGNDTVDQIVSTTRRRRVKKSQSVLLDVGSDVEKDDGFFEDDCDVLDFAADRV